METDLRTLRNYLRKLEKQVMLEGIQQGIFTKRVHVSRKKGKLAFTEFGRTIGTRFKYQHPLVLDYYGLQKKSSTLLELFSQYPDKNMISTNIIYFASVKMEHISTFAPELLKEFQKFKNMIIKLRNFKKS